MLIFFVSCKKIIGIIKKLAFKVYRLCQFCFDLTNLTYNFCTFCQHLYKIYKHWELKLFILKNMYN